MNEPRGGRTVPTYVWTFLALLVGLALGGFLPDVMSPVAADWHVTVLGFTPLLQHLTFPTWNGLDIVYTAVMSDSNVNANARVTINGPIYNTQDEKGQATARL